MTYINGMHRARTEIDAEHTQTSLNYLPPVYNYEREIATKGNKGSENGARSARIYVHKSRSGGER